MRSTGNCNMINIFIDCNQELQKDIQSLIDSYQITITKEINNQTIIIKEIINSDDITNIKNKKNRYHCHIICIIDNFDFIFEIIDLLPLSIWRKKHIFHDSKILMDIIPKENVMNTVMEFKVNTNTILVNTKDIIYLESFSHYLTIHTVNTNFQIREKISTARKKFEKYGFIQIHKSYLVNKKYIKMIKSKNCLLKNNISLPIGKKFNNIQL